uniref:MSP domain-containing protein n=1 Tax=Kalanchoe fedtschenkoi TaxID=63787 RepID=A0A7N0UE13_KALFE
MGPEQLLEIHPRKLMFVFELKKQSSDPIQLFNSSDHFGNMPSPVKTTSPKKYCVRPNLGIVRPKSTFTMQAQREAPAHIQCKDKFLVERTIVPYGTKEEDIASDLFSKSSGNAEGGSYKPISRSGTKFENESPDRDDQIRNGLDKPLCKLVGLLYFSKDTHAIVILLLVGRIIVIRTGPEVEPVRTPVPDFPVEPAIQTGSTDGLFKCNYY